MFDSPIYGSCTIDRPLSSYAFIGSRDGLDEIHREIQDLRNRFPTDEEVRRKLGVPGATSFLYVTWHQWNREKVRIQLLMLTSMLNYLSQRAIQESSVEDVAHPNPPENTIVGFPVECA
ncbi:MAG: hypothetical protein ACE5FT_03895 [Candidatus Nanoarchaeia archaeon]